MRCFGEVSMKVSTKGRYGLRVMMELASRYGQGPVPVEVIAKSQEISGKYIHILVGTLRSAGLVRTARGPNGGYELTRKPSTITALDIVSVLEGRTIPVDCVADATACHRSKRCAARDLWCEVASAMDRVLANLTLEQLVDRQRNKLEEPASYQI
jgi:Rrf2 family protein